MIKTYGNELGETVSELFKGIKTLEDRIEKLENSKNEKPEEDEYKKKALDKVEFLHKVMYETLIIRREIDGLFATRSDMCIDKRGFLLSYSGYWINIDIVPTNLDYLTIILNRAGEKNPISVILWDMNKSYDEKKNELISSIKSSSKTPNTEPKPFTQFAEIFGKWDFKKSLNIKD